MTYTVTDIKELIRHHLVLSVDDDTTADDNLRRLAYEIESMATTAIWRPIEWVFATAAGARWTPISSTPTGTTTPTTATSTAPTAVLPGLAWFLQC